MGRKKHAWHALYEEMHSEMPKDGNRLLLCEQAVEGAAIEDFTDELYERFDELRTIVQESNNPQISLGIELALRELRYVLDRRLV